MNAQKHTFALALATVALISFGSKAMAASDLLNSALNESLEERASVTAEYKSNAAAERPDNHFNDRLHSERIKLTINGELNGGSAGDRLKDHDSPNRVYREGRIQAKLDQELKSVDQAFSKTEVAKPVVDKAEGFQYSEGRLPK